MAKQKRTIKGTEAVMRNLNREIKAIKGRTMRGLIESAIIVRRSMESTSPKVSVDLGNLRASWFVVTSTGIPQGEGDAPLFNGPDTAALQNQHAEVVSSAKSVVNASKKALVIIGFSANYAVWVHELVEGDINWNRPGSGAKFLEAHLKMNEKEIIQTIAQHAKIK